MPNGRAVLLLRRLSTSDNRRKGLNFSDFSQNIKDPPNSIGFNKDLALQRRFYYMPIRDQPNQLITDKIKTMTQSVCSCSSYDSDEFVKPNRLITEKSPYLLQHAYNPVAWYPWGIEAISKAKAENKPIFLSVGFSTCHWCHRMEKETFNNSAVAQILNENFVCIKVDREERPDIDRVYTVFLQASSGYCGWPLNVFLTPDLKPITGGTYYTLNDEDGLPGFTTILTKLQNKWNNEQDMVLSESEKMFKKMKKKSTVKSGADDVPGENVIQDCLEYYMLFYEPEFGGFGTAPKFPQISILNFIFNVFARDKNHSLAPSYLDICLNTLTNMARGGIRDHVGGGFARYSVDNHWHVPHFEKMLYDQAQIMSAYTDAYLVSKNEFYAEVVTEIVRYVNRDLRHALGGYFSAEDADSLPTAKDTEKKEGAFYVWEMSEIRELLKNKTIKGKQYLHIFCDYFNIEPDGNATCDIHNQLENKNVLIAYEKRENIAKKYGITKENFCFVLRSCLDTLYQARAKRPRPERDTKIICSWNGLMVSALARSGQALGNASLIDDALVTAKFIRKHLYNKETKTLKHVCYTAYDGSLEYSNASFYAFMEDYAYVIKGLLDLYEATLEPKWLKFARTLQTKQNDLFWDNQDGAYFTCMRGKHIIINVKETKDGAEPAGNSVSCLNLQRLAVYADKADKTEQKNGQLYRDMAKKILSAYTKIIEDTPTAMPEMMCALICYHDSPTQVLITGVASDPRTMELVRVVRSRLIPGRVLAVTEPQTLVRSPGLNPIKAPSVPTAFVCRRFSCSLPVTSVRDLEYLLDYPQTIPRKTGQTQKKGMPSVWNKNKQEKQIRT